MNDDNERSTDALDVMVAFPAHGVMPAFLLLQLHQGPVLAGGYPQGHAYDEGKAMPARRRDGAGLDDSRACVKAATRANRAEWIVLAVRKRVTTTISWPCVMVRSILGCDHCITA
jgi:hypothetical protein